MKLDDNNNWIQEDFDDYAEDVDPGYDGIGSSDGNGFPGTVTLLGTAHVVDYARYERALREEADRIHGQ